MKTESETKSKSIQLINWILMKLEARAERIGEKADNHQLISKLTFILVDLSRPTFSIKAVSTP